MKIKNPLYDYLVQLIKEKNEDVLKILSDGIRIGTITEYVMPQNQTGLTQLITPEKITREGAVTTIEELINDILQMDAAEGESLIENKLSKECQGRLLQTLLNTIKDRKDFSEELINSIVDYGTLFYHVKPLYDIHVEPSKDDRGVNGAYDILLVNRNTETEKSYKIKFSLATAKALYLFFLLYPDAVIKPSEMEDNKAVSKLFLDYYFKVYDMLYKDTKKLEKALSGKSTLKYETTKFRQVISKAVSDVKTSIENALNSVNGDDDKNGAVSYTDDPNWYIIEADKTLGKYQMNYKDGIKDYIFLPREIANYVRQRDFSVQKVELMRDEIMRRYLPPTALNN